jgi:chemotaxis regulatin CheY-phosphate phosphatase CheZ
MVHISQFDPLTSKNLDDLDDYTIPDDELQSDTSSIGSRNDKWMNNDIDDDNGAQLNQSTSPNLHGSEIRVNKGRQ